VLSQAVGNLGVLRRGQAVVSAVGDVDDVQRAASDVGDAAACRVQPGIDDRPGCRQLLRFGRLGPGDPELAVESERDRPAGCIGGEGSDAAGQLANALAPDPLGLRQVAVAVAGQGSRVRQ
jgi:hypothetical protein